MAERRFCSSPTGFQRLWLSDETYAFANQLAERERKLLDDMGIEFMRRRSFSL